MSEATGKIIITDAVEHWVAETYRLNKILAATEVAAREKRIALERRIMELEAEVARYMQELADTRRTRELAVGEINHLEEVAAHLRMPCRCDPPGSGEYCNGACRMRSALEMISSVPRSGEAWLMRDWMLKTFDDAVIEVRQRRSS
jgi:hypothetical protein